MLIGLPERIKKLRNEALTAQDYEQCVICDLALGIAVFDKDGYPLYDNHELYEAAWNVDPELNQAKAFSICKKVVNG
jgi:hypothetical protein